MRCDMTKAEQKLMSELIILDKPEMVKNPYSGESVMLCPEAVALYDLIKGAEMLGHYDSLELALGIFIQKYPKEYMILLD
jgi:hypothetical protein